MADILAAPSMDIQQGKVTPVTTTTPTNTDLMYTAMCLPVDYSSVPHIYHRAKAGLDINVWGQS